MGEDESLRALFSARRSEIPCVGQDHEHQDDEPRAGHVLLSHELPHEKRPHAEGEGGERRDEELVAVVVVAVAVVVAEAVHMEDLEEVDREERDGLDHGGERLWVAGPPLRCMNTTKRDDDLVEGRRMSMRLEGGRTEDVRFWGMVVLR